MINGLAYSGCWLRAVVYLGSFGELFSGSYGPYIFRWELIESIFEELFFRAVRPRPLIINVKTFKWSITWLNWEYSTVSSAFHSMYLLGVTGKIAQSVAACSKILFILIHRTDFCVRRTDGAAWIYFFLSLSLPERVTLWSRIIPVHVRERERGEKKEEEEESPEKPLHHDQDLNPQTLSREPSVLSIRPQRPASWAFIGLCLLSLDYVCFHISIKKSFIG